MPENEELRKQLLTQVTEGKLVDFQALGKAVGEAGPELFKNVGAAGGDAATDGIVWGVSSVVHVYHTMPGELNQEVVRNATQGNTGGGI
jgi:hypothetical protein